jgi:hypothetical protein
VGKNEQRKVAIAAFRERKPRIGIYAMRCLPTSAAWVGRSTDLEAIRNRILFTLTQGSSPHRTLQSAWNEAGPENFAFEEIEVLGEELSVGMQDLWLKQRLAHWVTDMKATRI